MNNAAQESSDLNSVGVDLKGNGDEFESQVLREAMRKGVFLGIESGSLNTALHKEAEVMQMLDEMSSISGVDGRALAVARTQIQTGFMWLFRAVTIQAYQSPT